MKSTTFFPGCVGEKKLESCTEESQEVLLCLLHFLSLPVLSSTAGWLWGVRPCKMKQHEMIIVMDFFFFFLILSAGTDRYFFLLFPLDWEQEVDLPKTFEPQL